MSDNEVVKTDIGLAEKLTMDEFCRTLVAQMFENDNDLATLEVVLNGTDATDSPKLRLELRLTEVNGMPTRSKSSA